MNGGTLLRKTLDSRVREQPRQNSRTSRDTTSLIGIWPLELFEILGHQTRSRADTTDKLGLAVPAINIMLNGSPECNPVFLHFRLF